MLKIKTKTSSNPMVRLMGISFSNNISKIKSIICFRKPMNKKSAYKATLRYKHAIGMVSSCKLYRKYNGSLCKAWCHCYRTPKKYIGSKPSILLSESDFIDPAIVTSYKRLDHPKWDFYYFTIGGSLGIKYKGLDLFAECLSVLCGEFGLKGVVVQYGRFNRKNYLSEKHLDLIEKYKQNLKIVNRFLSNSQIACLMSSCRFGFFPNYLDCSPLLLTESLVRKCPILVNENILGGWKYVNEETGSFFNVNNVGDKIEFILKNNFSNIKSYYMSKYGYKNSAIRFAKFMSNHFKECRHMKMIAIAGSKKQFKDLVNII